MIHLIVASSKRSSSQVKKKKKRWTVCICVDLSSKIPEKD